MFKCLLNYWRTRQGRVATVMVVAFASALGYLNVRTFIQPLPKQYDLDFGRAEWIQTAQPAPAAYFRKTIFLSNDVVSAWMEVAATGVFDVYINNILIDHVSFPCARPSAIYDLKQIMSSGKNVIGIHVGAGMYPGLPQALARVGYTMRGGDARQEVVTDGTWKASATPDGIPGSYAWSSPKLDDTLWTDAQTAPSGEQFSTLLQSSQDPRLITEAIGGKWIEARSSEVSFSYDLTVPHGPSRTWIQLAANGAYDLLVNRHLVALTPAPMRSVLFGPQAPVDLIGQSRPASDMPEVVTPWMDMAGVSTLSAIQPSDKLTQSQNSTAVTVMNASGQPVVVHRQVEASTVALHQPLLPLNAPAATGVSMPDLSQITPPSAPTAPQVIPQAPELGATDAGLVLTAYEISSQVHPGTNAIIVRVHSVQGPAVMIADGVTSSFARVSRFGSGSDWKVLGREGSNSPPMHAAVIADNGDPPWGLLSQIATTQSWLPGQDVRYVARWISTMAAMLVIVMGLWLSAGWLFSSAEVSAETLWNIDAIVQVTMLMGVLGLIASSFDVRLPYDWCFRPMIAVALLAAVPLSKIVLIAARIGRWTVKTRIPSVRAGGTNWPLIGLIAIAVAAFFVRAIGLNDQSMSHDEVGMSLMAQGVLQTGFPHIMTGSYVKYPATYEIVPYPIALSTLIFGMSRFAHRLPALLFGASTVLLIGWVGRRMMGWRVGLAAALIYAFLPTTIYWGRDGFYLAQEGFFSLATIWLFYEAIQGEVLDRRCLMWAAIGSVLSYLSWEGSGFMLPALFVALVVVRWGDFGWVTNRFLWRYFMVVTVIVVLQLSYRQLVILPDFLGAVSDLSDLSTPSLVFLDRAMFDPLFYLKVFFLSENFLPLTLITLIGIIFVQNSRPLKFLYVMLAMLLLLYTGFLASYAPRYCYFWTPLLVLAASGSFFYLWDQAKELAVPGIVGYLRTITVAAATIMLIVGVNPFVAKFYRMAQDAEHPGYFTRYGAEYKPDYHSADRYVADHIQPGDAVIAMAPHVFRFDTGRTPDYWMDTMLLQRITYDGGRAAPVYVDKWIGIQALRSLDDLQEVNSRYRRIWLLEPNVDLNAPNVINYVRVRGQVVHEGFLETVTLLKGAAAPDALETKTADARHSAPGSAAVTTR